MRVSQNVDLSALIDLMNWDGQQSLQRDVLPLLIDAELLQIGPAKIVETSIRRVRAFKAEMEADLSGVIDCNDEKSKPERLNDLVNKINGLGLAPQWVVEPGTPKVREVRLRWRRGGGLSGLRKVKGPWIANPALRYLGPDQKKLRLQRGMSWIVRRRLPVTASAREQLYWTVITAIENGSLATIARCPSCGKWRLRSNNKRRFCNDTCRYRFFNSEPGRNDRVKKWRKERKKQRINLACKLRDQHRPLQQILKETGLSRLALDREGVIGKDEYFP